MATDTGNGEPIEGLWLTLSDLARERGITKGPLSRRVSRLEELGLLKTKPGERGSKLINVAEFDKVVGETTDGVRELNGTAGKEPPHSNQDATPTDASALTKQQARRAAYAADLAQLDIEERLGKLLQIEKVEAAMVRCAEAIVRKIDQLPMQADDLSSSVARDGAAGARSYLRTMARQLREALAAEMALIIQSPTPSDDNAV